MSKLKNLNMDEIYETMDLWDEEAYMQQFLEQQIEQAAEDKMIENFIEQQSEETVFDIVEIDQMIDDMIEQSYEDLVMMNSYTPRFFSPKELSILDNMLPPKHHYRKSIYEFYAFISYLPIRFESDQTEKLRNKIIYAFKDGQKSVIEKVAGQVCEFIKKEFSNQRNYILMVIPASTKNKNSLRFESFTNIVCEDLSILNGFNGISIIEDRRELKGQSTGDKVKNLRFNTDVFKGKHVILFDDVITSGESFRQVADILIKEGAKKVTGLFLAKTVHK